MMRAVAILALTTMAAPAAAQPGWTGTYRYYVDQGRDGAGAGNAIGVDYKLVLGGRAGCRLTALGFQTSEDIRCTATPVRGGVRIAFKSYSDGKVANEYGVILYRSGTVLFTLTRGKQGIVTTWGALRPEGVRRASGRYFEKG